MTNFAVQLGNTYERIFLFAWNMFGMFASLEICITQWLSLEL